MIKKAILSFLVLFLSTSTFGAASIHEKIATIKIENIIKKLKSALGDEYFFVESQSYPDAPNKTIYAPSGIASPSFDYDIRKTDSIKRPLVGLIDIYFDFVFVEINDTKCAAKFLPEFPQFHAINITQAIKQVHEWRSCNTQFRVASRYAAQLTYLWENGEWTLADIRGNDIDGDGNGNDKGAKIIFTLLGTGKYENRRLVYDPQNIQKILLGK